MSIYVSTCILIGLAAYLGHFVVARMARAKALGLADRLKNVPCGTDMSASLPPMVREFAMRSGAVQGLGMRVAVLTQIGQFRKARGTRLMAFSARQIIGLGAPGFLWQARMRSGLLVIRVTDALVAGAGLLEVRAFGSWRLAQSTDRETTLAEAFRYLAELPWAPDAILGNPQLVWQMTGRHEVEVHLDTKQGRATVQFTFDDAGDIVEMWAEGRPAQDAKGQPTHYPWRGRFSEYTQIGPRRLPQFAEVGYVYPSGYEAYFRSQITGYEVTG
jgi:hypothetical protein